MKAISIHQPWSSLIKLAANCQQTRFPRRTTPLGRLRRPGGLSPMRPPKPAYVKYPLRCHTAGRS